LRSVIDSTTPGKASQPNRVAHVELILNQEQHAVEHVLNDVLCREANRDARDTGRSQERGEIEAHGVERLQQRDNADDGEACGFNDAGHGFDLGTASQSRTALVGSMDHARSGETQQAAEHKGDDRNHNQPWQLGVDELLAIVDPLIEDPAKEPALLEPAPAQHQNEFCRVTKKRHSKTPLSRLTRLNCAQEWPESGPCSSGFSPRGQ
jgi:hypothetical protein